MPERGPTKRRVWLRSWAVVATLLLDWMPLCTGEGKAAAQKINKRKGCKAKHDPHGKWEGTRDLGDEYTLVCKNGYAVDGKQNATITCSDEGLWDADPWCENRDDCIKLLHGCGPGGLCVDHVGYAECLCEEGATKRLAANGEEVCYFHGAAKNARCGNLSCGSHGVCVDLAQYQDTFDTGSTAFRCSCQEGYHDNGETCVPLDCGERADPLGTWTGDTVFGGEYTLTCAPGAFIWGGSEEAITVACGKKGTWSNTIRCMEREQEAKDAGFATFRFWMNIALSLLCICTAALAAGLTMGLVSQEKLELFLIQKMERSEGAGQGMQDYARQLLDIKKDHHQLLVTLLLLNAFANEALPIFLDELVTPECAVLLSVTLVLLFGEILPSAAMTSQRKLELVMPLIPLVKIFLIIFSFIAKPIALLLDCVLREEEGDLYTRAELRAVLRMHCGQVGQPESSSIPNATSPMVRDGSFSAHSRVHLLDFCAEDTNNASIPPACGDCWPAPERVQEAPPLHPLEGDLFARVMDMGETKVTESRGFRPISGRRKKCCATDFMAAEETAYALQTAVNAIQSAKEGVVVFQSAEELEDWPNSVQVRSILAVMRVVDLLTLDSKKRLADLHFLKKCIDVDKASTVTDTLCALGNDNNPNGFVIVTDPNNAGEFLGLLDGQDALLGLTPGWKQGLTESQPVKVKSQRDECHRTTAKTVAEALRVPLQLTKGGERLADVPGVSSETSSTYLKRVPLRKNSAPADALRTTSKDEEDVFERKTNFVSPVLQPLSSGSAGQNNSSSSPKELLLPEARADDGPQQESSVAADSAEMISSVASAPAVFAEAGADAAGDSSSSTTTPKAANTAPVAESRESMMVSTMPTIAESAPVAESSDSRMVSTMPTITESTPTPAGALEAVAQTGNQSAANSATSPSPKSALPDSAEAAAGGQGDAAVEDW